MKARVSRWAGRAGGRITGGEAAKVEWKERKRRTYWIDQRVPTTLLPYFLPLAALVHSFPQFTDREERDKQCLDCWRRRSARPLNLHKISGPRFLFVSQARLLQRLYYRSESDVPYWPAEEHPYKRMNGKQARSILLELCLLHPPLPEIILLYSYILIPSLSFPLSACWDLFPLDFEWKFNFLSLK